MNIREVIEVFVKHLKDQPVMVSPGTSSNVLRELAPRNLIMPGVGMSYVSPCCFGLAFARPDLKVIAVEGDGSLIMGLTFLTTLARYPVKNLIILVIDNGAYLSTDHGQLLTATAGRTDLRAIAKGAGIEKAATAATVEDLDHLLQQALMEDGPFVIVAKVDRSLRRKTTSISAEGTSTRDRSDLSTMFRRRLMETRSESKSDNLVRSEWKLKCHLDQVEYGLPPGRVIYQALKEAGVDLVVYLPETVTFPIQVLAENDPEMPTICCGREDEGVAIASGAYYGGLLPAIVIEGTGVGISGLALASSALRRTPVVIVSSHPETLGVRYDHDMTSMMTNEPILKALHLPYIVLTRIDDAVPLIRELLHSMRILKIPVGVVIPPYLMSDRGLG